MANYLTCVKNIHSAVRNLIFQVEKTQEKNPFIPISILLPNANVIQDLRKELGNTLGVQLVQFYHLGQSILDQANLSIQELDDVAIRRLVRDLLFKLFKQGELSTFSKVYDKPGFTEVLINWIREMKSQGITPEQYADFSAISGNERDQQLATIYANYQDFMHKKQFSDADGLLWVAAEALEKDSGLFQTAGPLFVLGFDQFNPIQIRILQQLQGRFTALYFYLQWDASRPSFDPTLDRLTQTRNKILKNFAAQEIVLQVEAAQTPALLHLHDTLFQSGEKITADNQALKMVAAPSREAEVRFTLREVKLQLLDGVIPHDIAILAPDPDTYLPILRSIAEEYNLPVQCETPLVENPAIAALIRLLHLGPDFSWQATLDSLRSPYFHLPWLSLDQIDLIEQLSRERLVIFGRQQWADAFTPLVSPEQDRDDEDLASPGLAAQITTDQLTSLQAGLEAFFDHLTPEPSASYSQYTAWIQDALIGLVSDDENPDEEYIVKVTSLNMLGCTQSGPFPDRDLQALSLLVNALRKLLAASEIAATNQTISWETYRSELMEIIQQTRIPAEKEQLQVRFGRLEEGRARKAEILFVLGLSEGEFPSAPPIDVLYAPGERETHPLPLVRFSPTDEASLWWQVLGNVRRRVILTRPYIDENGAPWQASPYWEAVLDSFKDLSVDTIPINDYPKVDTASSLHELYSVLAYQGAHTVLDALGEMWDYVQHAYTVIQQRQNYRPPGEYEGVFQSLDLIDEVSGSFGEQHCWSASRLNRYANCPYGFFAEYVLQLSKRDEPQDGLDALQRGSLLHAVLEHFYRGLASSGLATTQTNREELMRRLDQSCKLVFAIAPGKFGFRTGLLWDYEQIELQRLLRSLIIWEIEQNGEQAIFLPYLQEAAFGFTKEFPPVELWVDEISFRFHGIIDRLDRDQHGNLRVVDYKSGSTTFSKNDLEKGLALQTALYALAAERNWLASDAQVKESCYLHIPSRKTSGRIVFDESVEENEQANSAFLAAAKGVQLVRRGVFPSVPGKSTSSAGGVACAANCDFSALCRVSREGIRKARQAGLA